MIVLLQLLDILSAQALMAQKWINCAWEKIPPTTVIEIQRNLEV